MSAKSHTFRIGQHICTALLDGSSVIGREGMMRRFPSVAEAASERAYADIGLSLDEADSFFNILAMQIGDEMFLVDTGQGGRPTGGELLASMAQAGLTPEVITHIILTHTHPDHVLGLLTDAGEPVFPNATYIISEVELTFWQERMAALPDQQPILAMMQARGLRQVAMDERIVPGLTAIPLPGHTPGQIGLRLESDGMQLLHLADLLHSPVQFAHPDWSPRFDTDTRQSVPTRRAMLGQVADEGVLTLFYHLTFPGLGQVERAGAAFRWLAQADTNL